MKKSIFLFLFIISKLSFSQNIISFSNDQYSGINGNVFSPTTSYFNPNKWDINVISEDLIFHNDYAFISKQNILGLKNSKIKVANHDKGINGETIANILDFYDKNSVSYNLENDLMGPSVSFQKNIKGKTYRLGVITRNRLSGSVYNFDNYMKYQNFNINEPKEYIFQPLNTNFMHWGEIGLNLSTNIYKTNEDELIIGGNLKYLMGFDAAFIKSNQPIKLEADLDNTESNQQTNVYASNYDINASYTSNYDFDRNLYKLRNRGNGIGLDFGLTYAKRSNNDKLYDYKISFNILDIGFVNLKGENHHFINNEKRVQILNNPKLNNDFESIEQYLKILSQEVYNDENKSKLGEKFTIGLPTSLHFNISQKVQSNHYINFNWIQRLPVFENSLKRSNIVQVSYGIQKDFLGFSPSISLYNYNKITLGGYMRFGPLILGSDHALPLIFKQKKLNSGNIYFGLKLYPFWDNETKRRAREKCLCN